MAWVEKFIADKISAGHQNASDTTQINSAAVTVFKGGEQEDGKVRREREG